MLLTETCIITLDILNTYIMDNFKNTKRSKKFKKRKYEENLTNMLNDAMDKDPQTAWKITDEMKRDTVQTDKSEQINRTKWFDQFHKILTPEHNQYGNDRKENVKDELSDSEKINQTCILDYEITGKEILAACQKLKNYKASSYDLIRNEMLKSAIPFVCKLVMQALNIILNSGIFPKS